MDDLSNRKENHGKLEDLRDQIDDIDRKLLELFEMRMETVREVAEYKAANHVKILDASREDIVLAKTKLLKSPQLEKYAAGFLKSLMTISKSMQEEFIGNHGKEWEKETKKHENQIIGFQGLPGSYSDQAAREYFGEGISSKNYPAFEDVFQALEVKEIEYGVLPLENSFAGAVAEVYGLLCRYGFYIVGEKCVQVDHNLLAVPGTSIEDIQEVYSHPQAILQSSRYLNAHPEWEQVACSNTAVSAKQIADAQSTSKAAIASKKAAEIYGLSILVEGINNTVTNFTRFIIIGRNPEFTSHDDKLSIALAVKHEPGSLYRVLKSFAQKGLNMLKIESRPMENKTWEYLFYIDLEGNIESRVMAEAIEEIKQESTFFRLLGNYELDK